MDPSQRLTPAIPPAFAEAIDSYQIMKSQRWARTSLHRVLPLPITASTWVAAVSCTTQPSHTNFDGLRWRKFLWLSLRTGTQSSSGHTPRRVSHRLR
jgi:hypothetical protein